MTDDFVRNPKAPNVVFRKIRGRIVPIVGGKRHRRGEKILEMNLDAMNRQVEKAEAGTRLFSGSGTTHRVIAQPSTFPTYFRQLGFKSKKEWQGAFRKKGEKYQRVVEFAAGEPDFQIATKQIFDNYLVNFRTIEGKVRPLRAKSLAQYKRHQPIKKQLAEVPF